MQEGKVKCDFSLKVSDFCFPLWLHFGALALQRDKLLLTLRGKLMGLQQRITQTTFEWANAFPAGVRGAKLI